MELLFYRFHFVFNPTSDVLPNPFFKLKTKVSDSIFPLWDYPNGSPVPPISTVMAGLSNYALRMARLSSRIFGEVAHPTDAKSLKVVQLFQEPPMAKRKEVYDWYPQHKIYYAMTQKLRYMGLFRYGSPTSTQTAVVDLKA